MEGCWDFAALPDPKDYGWENVQYEYHWYNWWSDTLSYDLFYSYQDMSNIGRDYDVPVYIGEFSYFENKDAWEEGLQLFKDRNYSWTIWNYKTTTVGWWTSSWGVYTLKLNLDTKTEELKTNVKVKAKKSYYDLDIEKNIAKDEEYIVSKPRAEYLESINFVEII